MIAAGRVKGKMTAHLGVAHEAGETAQRISTFCKACHEHGVLNGILRRYQALV